MMRYPSEWENVTAGSVIRAAELEAITRLVCGTVKYRVALLKLRADLMEVLAERGLNYAVKIHGDELHVLSAPESSEYNHDMVRAGLRRTVGYHRRNMEVNPEELTDDQRAQHERNLISDGNVVAAILATRYGRTPLPQPHKRAIPAPAEAEA